MEYDKADGDRGVGERIKALRRDRDLTQGELAALIGVSRSAVAQWETGRSGQVRDNALRIASILGVGVDWLLDGDDRRQGAEAITTGDELAMVRLYRACSGEDRQFLLRTARKLAALPAD